jgi:hypothetical protein
MQSVETFDRRPSPAPRPHPLASHAGLLWFGSWETSGIYAVDPHSWEVRREFASPGKPYGMTSMGGELRVVVGLGEDDDRYIYRLNPERGFDLETRVACPDLTGSYLAADGTTLYLGQMTNRRILVLTDDATVQREIALPSRCAGIGFGPGGFHSIAGDAELEHLKFGRLDVSQSQAAFHEIMPLPDEARSLVYDGKRWWTCLRDGNEIASFAGHAE